MDIKFKPDESEQAAADEKQMTKCGICKKASASYTCPRCNLVYCGLDCYRNEEIHANCSEEFYKEQVITELKMCKLDADDKDCKEHKRRIVDILKREAKRMESDELRDEELEEEDEEKEAKENVLDDELLRFYCSKARNWKPWWHESDLTRALVEELEPSKPIQKNLNSNLIRNSSSINTSNSSPLLYNDILLLNYSYFLVAYIYQLEAGRSIRN